MENTTLDALQTELEFYRQNQAAVEEEIRTVITDNQKLSQQVGMLLKEKLQSARQAQTLDDEQAKELEDLKRQVSLITKERDSLHVLWQTSQKTIDALEAELKAYQSYETRGKQNGNEDRRDLELKLETSLTDYIELEAKFKELNIKHNSLENELKSKEKEIITYKERGKQLEEQVEELQKTLEECRIDLGAEKKNNEVVTSQLIKFQKECVDKVKKEAEAKSKVAEALQLYDVVSAQKTEAVKKIAILSEEQSELKNTLANVKREAESRYRAELDEIKNNYNEKLADMLQHIRNLDSELVEKGLLLNKALRENKVLQEINESYVKQEKDCINAVDPKIALAEKRIEAMFQELVSSERRYIQMSCEKECLAIEIQRMQDGHTREIKRRDWEEKLIKTQCDELKMQVDHLQQSLEETHGMINKLQSMMSSRTELSQKMVTTKEEELIELNKHLENQMELSKKWKESYVEMSEKLKKRLEDMKKENEELRAKLNLSYNGSSNQDSSS